MLNKSLKLNFVNKLDFGRRKLSPKEFSLLWRMILNHFSNVEEAESFHWEDTTIIIDLFLNIIIYSNSIFNFLNIFLKLLLI